MECSDYIGNTLHIEKLSLMELISSYPTPFYCYSKGHIVSQFKALQAAFNFKETLIAYALKANSNTSIISMMADLGGGADVVSGWEIQKALDAAVLPKNIVFSGIAKTEEELNYALETGIGQFNVESIAEIEYLSKLATIRNKVADIAIRLNPDVDADTHHKIATGGKEAKFGIAVQQVRDIAQQLKSSKHIRTIGLSLHIGSQIFELETFAKAFRAMASLAKELNSMGFQISTLDFGGGIGIRYRNENTISIHDYGNLIKEVTKDLDVKIILEPGRLIVGNAGMLISKVLYVKDTPFKKTFLIIDAGMNDFMRPSLYNATHNIIPIVINHGRPKRRYTVVGPVCESGDVLRKSAHMDGLYAGEYIAITGTGAYGYAMSNNYNLRPKLAEIMVDGNEASIIRRRETYKEYCTLEN